MFSANVRCLPSCNTYEGAVNIFERAASKPTPNWPVGTRPLEDRRKTQYAVIRDGGKVVFRLHNTNVVEWYGPTSMRLDSSWDSLLTRAFADNFIPPGIGFRRYQDEGCVLTYDTDKMMCRGTHLFTRGDDGVWRPDAGWVEQYPAAVRKPKRMVVDKDQAAVVNEKLKDFVEWAKALWAVSGSDGHHPWVGQANNPPWGGAAKVPLDFGPDQYEDTIKQFLPTRSKFVYSVGTQYTIGHAPIEWVLKKVREAAYEAHNCYIKIDYDAPVPRRTKK